MYYLELRVAAAGLRRGFGDFGGDVGPFVEQDAGVVFEGRGEDEEGLVERGDGAPGDDVGVVAVDPIFGALRDDLDVGEFQLVDDGLDETGLFLGGFEEREFYVGKDEGERDAGEAGAGAGVDDVESIGEEAPGEDGIENVFDGGFAGIGDAGEVHHLVDFDDHVEVEGGLADDVVPVGEVLGEELGEFVGEGHPSILAPGAVFDKIAACRTVQLVGISWGRPRLLRLCGCGARMTA